MDAFDLIFLSAYELADAIRQKKVSAVEVLDAHVSQIAQHNPALNVIVTLDVEKARERAKAADAALARGERWGSLHGVPFTVKDGFATAGLRTTSGNPAWADFVPQVDAPVVARLRSAGGILLGKTNLPTMSFDAQTHNPIFGRTNNPWNLQRTSGGSTGGAAAVAAGMTPLELGSDLAGSVRIPAHFCGVYSLKPTEFRFPDGGYHPNPNQELAPTGGLGLGVFGPLARSIDDLVLAFQLLAAPDSEQWTNPPVPVDPLPDLKMEHLRLAWTSNIGGIPISSAVQQALSDVVAKLEPLVSKMEPHLPHGFNFATAWKIWGELVPVMFGLSAEVVAATGAHAQSEAATDRGLAKGPHLTPQEFLENLRGRSLLITVLERFFTEVDALILPVTLTPAFPHCLPTTPILVDDEPVDYSIATIACTCPFNLTGHPVVTMPVALSAEGLPIGLQIVGRRWNEMRLLAIAKRIAEVIGSLHRPPGY